MDLEAFYKSARERTQDIREHLPTFTSLVEEMNAQLVIELGTGSGIATSAWLRGLHKTGGKLWSVDILHDTHAEQLLGISPNWTYEVGHSLELAHRAPYNADILFIDSGHTYDLTISELDIYTPHVRPGGVILLHDTETAHAEVTPALNDWCDRTDREWTNDRACYGLGRVQL